MTESMWDVVERASRLAVRLAQSAGTRAHCAAMGDKTMLAQCKCMDQEEAIRDAVQLCQLGQKLHRMAEADCNRGLTKLEERRRTKDQALVTSICKRHGLQVEFNGDPRGYAVKIKGLGIANSWDESYGV